MFECKCFSFKVAFWLSGFPLYFNIGPQWQIYFLQSIQWGLTRHVLEASIIELTICNVVRICLHMLEEGCVSTETIASGCMSPETLASDCISPDTIQH